MPDEIDYPPGEGGTTPVLGIQQPQDYDTWKDQFLALLTATDVSTVIVGSTPSELDKKFNIMSGDTTGGIDLNDTDTNILGFVADESTGEISFHIPDETNLTDPFTSAGATEIEAGASFDDFEDSQDFWDSFINSDADLNEAADIKNGFIDSDADIQTAQDAKDTFVDESGDEMTGTLDLSSGGLILPVN